MGARIVLIVASAALALWLGLGLHSARLESHALSLAGQKGRGAEVDDALRRARAHSHDTRPLYLQAQFALFSGDRAAAARALEQVVRREPENFDAWRSLALADSKLAPARAAQARRRALELSPPVS